MTIRRRDFLKAAVGTPALLSFGSFVPPVLLRAAASAASHSDRPTALVVLQLSGGNDGLNTVVPFSDDQYGRNRRTLRLTASEVLKIDDHLGFHPAMEGMARLLAEGRLSVIQGVGYEANDRDHEVAMRDWHTARPGDTGCETGWLGRAIDSVEGPARIGAPGVFVGPIPKPVGMTAQRSVVPHVRSLDDMTLAGPVAAGEAVGDLPASDNPLLEHVCRGAVAARLGSRQVQDVLQASATGGRYPDFPLAGQLKLIAELIRADLGIRIFFAELGGGGIGGFDNHANQRDNHASLLAQLSAAVTALIDDLVQAGLADRVALMTFSEFGRTLAENGRRGTDHGAAAPVLLAGGRLRGGLIGKHPDLTDLDADSPRPHTDFRRVYATLLDQWLGFDSRKILGRQFEPLNVVG
ncbi:MAG: DUF1501 domain-containing protein [Thermoguttaceae bacterium]|jgi:uncharacterized protein (DUF1501 family)|nr:DUF1501 domain-containing protein [Thermoguttaceae bacterium]